MPAPSAEFILSMLSPYKGFDPNEGARVAIGAGQIGESRAKRRQEAEQFGKTNARADAYFGLEQNRFNAGEAAKLKERQIDAFQKFNDALVNGDDEQASFWAGQLQQNGVGVQEYGGGAGQGPKSPAMGPLGGTTAGAAAPSAMDAYSSPGMSGGAAGAAAAATPPAPGRFPSEIGGNRYDPQTGNLIREQPEAPIRPKPAHTQSIGGQEPKPEAPVETIASPSDSAGASSEMPIQSGMNEAEAATVPSKGYRLSVAGRTIDLRPEDIRQRQEERVRGTLQALVNGARTPDEKRAAQAATDAAVKAIPIAGVKGATKLGVDHYEAELERTGGLNRAKYAAAGRANGGGPGWGFTKEGSQQIGGVRDDVESFITHFENNDQVKAAREGIATSDQVMGMVKSNNSIAEWAAQQGVLKQYVRGVTSDRDLAGFLGSTGRGNQILKEFNAWFEGGAMPEDINRKVGELAIESKRFLEKKLAMTAERAASAFERDYTFTSRIPKDELRNQARNVYYRIAGRERPEAKPQGRNPAGAEAAPTGGGGKQAPAPKAGGASSAQQRAEALKKKYGG